MPSKPAKYELKFWLLSDSDNYYCHDAQFYCGKEDDRPSNMSLGQHVVQSLVEHLKHSGRNVTCDNFFTSLPLAEQLHSKGLSVVGTMRSNKPEIPFAFQFSRSRPLFSTMQATLRPQEAMPSFRPLLVS